MKAIRHLLFILIWLMVVPVNAQYYVDLGLPSGTKWKDKNEWNSRDDHGFYKYEDAISDFGSNLPTKKQWEELERMCTWSWTGSGYWVTGPNYNHIVLPAAGIRQENGARDGWGSVGCYCSSTRDYSTQPWYIYFDSGKHGMYDVYHSYGYSVRLVQGQ